VTIIRLAFIAFCGLFGTFAVAHGAQADSWRWVAFGLVLWCVGFAMSCMPRVRVNWTWVIIIRDLTRRWR
jgi:type IV secretory pathway TrbD component